MKAFHVIAVLAVVLGLQAGAQTPSASTNPSDPNSLLLLRQTIADQTRNPDKIIRTYTNLPPEKPVTNLVAAAPQVEPPVFKPDPPQTAPLTPKAAAAAALERQYLEGRLTARQYEKALADLERANAGPAPASTKSKTPPARTTKPKPAPAETSTRETPVAAPATPPATTTRQQKVSEVESKIDEMIRQKEARERAAQTNSVPAPAGKLTKRQRLDFLLKQVVEGKLSDEEYKQQREKILAEPD